LDNKGAAGKVRGEQVMWIERVETGWVFRRVVNDRTITVHITRDPLKDILLYVNGKYVGFFNKGSFFFSKRFFDRIIYSRGGGIELHLKTLSL